MNWTKISDTEWKSDRGWRVYEKGPLDWEVRSPGGTIYIQYETHYDAIEDADRLQQIADDDRAAEEADAPKPNPKPPDPR